MYGDPVKLNTPTLSESYPHPGGELEQAVGPIGLAPALVVLNAIVQMTGLGSVVPGGKVNVRSWAIEFWHAPLAGLNHPAGVRAVDGQVTGSEDDGRNAIVCVWVTVARSAPGRGVPVDVSTA
jgi:hypothetical protein